VLDGLGSAYKGRVSGFGSGVSAHSNHDQFIEFAQISSGGSFSYTSANAANTSGTLKVVSGGVSATVTLVGHYSAGDFASSTVDGHMKITDPAAFAQDAVFGGGSVGTLVVIVHAPRLVTIIGSPAILSEGGSGPLTAPDGAVLVIVGRNSSTITFASSSGTVEFVEPTIFGGTVQNFAAQDRIDLPTIAFGAQTTLAYSTNSGGTGGVLTVTDGSHAAAIALLGNYMAASFVIGADGYGGTLVTPAHPAEQQPLLARPHPS
jgi:hypothetical protein